MFLFHNIGPRLNSNYNTLEEVLSVHKNYHISFDGLYRSVYEHRNQLKNRLITVFVCGSHVGKDNYFDKENLPNFQLEKFCTWEETYEFCRVTGARLGWHSWTHRSFASLSDKEVADELRGPVAMSLMAYPYGDVDERVANITRHMGYEEAWSVTQGDDSRFQRKRKYLNW